MILAKLIQILEKITFEIKKKNVIKFIQENVTQNANGRDMSDVVGW